MIKDAAFAEKELNKLPRTDATLDFVPRVDIITKEAFENEPIPKLAVKNPVIFPKTAPIGITYGLYVPGKIPKTKFEIGELQKDWAVVKAETNFKECILDEWPPLDTPIVVMIEGRTVYTEGIVVQHRWKDSDDMIHGEVVFMELLREGSFEFNAAAPVKFGIDGEIQSALFVPVDFKKIIAWVYLTTDGQMLHHPGRFRQPVDIFVDCEFDDTTRTLLSVGITNKMGRTHYAFDSEAAGRVEREWLKEHVIPVLLDVPKGTLVTDINARKTSWREWLMQVLLMEQTHQGGGIIDQDFVIHVDFPTDVMYISELLHLGEGVRIGQMRNFTFKIDYVDAYPTKLKGAVQHNAAWDAMAIWFHLGYYTYRVIAEMARHAENGLKPTNREVNDQHQDDKLMGSSEPDPT